jgi:hypothetical protein
LEAAGLGFVVFDVVWAVFFGFGAALGSLVTFFAAGLGAAFIFAFYRVKEVRKVAQLKFKL